MTDPTDPEEVFAQKVSLFRHYFTPRELEDMKKRYEASHARATTHRARLLLEYTVEVVKAAMG